MIDSPSGRLPEKDPRWDLSGTEAYGGGKSISWTLLRVSNFSGIYSIGIRSNGALWAPRGTRARLPPQARPGGSWAPQGSSGLLPKLLGSLVVQKRIVKNWHRIWTILYVDFP